MGMGAAPSWLALQELEEVALELEQNEWGS